MVSWVFFVYTPPCFPVRNDSNAYVVTVPYADEAARLGPLLVVVIVRVVVVGPPVLSKVLFFLLFLSFSLVVV